MVEPARQPGRVTGDQHTRSSLRDAALELFASLRQEYVRAGLRGARRSPLGDERPGSRTAVCSIRGEARPCSHHRTRRSGLRHPSKRDGADVGPRVDGTVLYPLSRDFEGEMLRAWHDACCGELAQLFPAARATAVGTDRTKARLRHGATNAERPSPSPGGECRRTSQRSAVRLDVVDADQGIDGDRATPVFDLVDCADDDRVELDLLDPRCRRQELG